MDKLESNIGIALKKTGEIIEKKEKENFYNKQATNADKKASNSYFHNIF